MCYANQDSEPAVTEGHLPLESIAKHMNQKQFTIGRYVTYSDFIFWEHLEFMNWLSEGRTFRKFQYLEDYHDRVSDLPRFKGYLTSERFIKYPFNSRATAIGSAKE